MFISTFALTCGSDAELRILVVALKYLCLAVFFEDKRCGGGCDGGGGVMVGGGAVW